MIAGKKFYSRRVFAVHVLLLGAVAIAAYLSVRAQFEALRDQLLEEARVDQQLTTRAGVLALQSQFRLLLNGLADADRPSEVDRTVPPGWLMSLCVVEAESRATRKIYRGTAEQCDRALARAGQLSGMTAPAVWVGEGGSVNVAVPMHAEKSVALAVVAGEQMAGDLAGLTQRSTSPTAESDGGVALVNETGQVLAGTVIKAGQRIQATLAKPVEARLNDLISSGYAGSELINTDGTTLLSVQPFVIGPGTRWSVVSVHTNVSAAVSQRLQPLFWQLLSLAAVMLLAVMIVIVSTTVSLTRSRRRIEKIRTEMINRDLAKARRIQLNWLPAPEFDGEYVCIAAENRPALHISGDFYNWFELPQDEDDRGRKTVVVIGDVSGHGLPAAFLMATTQLLVKNTMPRVRDPGFCLGDINRQLCSLVYAGQFVTMMILVIDHDTAGLEIASAGHHAPLLKRDGVVEPLPIEPQLVVGVDESTEYTTQRFRIRPGDLFLLYTDGATEMMNAASEQFGTDRLIQTLQAAVGGPKEMIEAVTVALSKFNGDVAPEDDLTLLAAAVVQADVEAGDAEEAVARSRESSEPLYDDV